MSAHADLHEKAVLGPNGRRGLVLFELLTPLRASKDSTPCDRELWSAGGCLRCWYQCRVLEKAASHSHCQKFPDWYVHFY